MSCIHIKAVAAIIFLLAASHITLFERALCEDTFTGFIEVGEGSFDDLGRPSFLAASDWNNDGYVDLLVNGYKLYANSGPPDYTFSRVSNVFQNSTSGGRNGVWGDLDGDGDLDLFQGCGKGTNDRIWLNSGSPDFLLEDVSSSFLGSWENPWITMGASWVDYDRDGDLDLYVECGEDYNDGDPIYYRDHFLRNDGSSFTDVTQEAGMRPTSENFYSRGSTWGDLNNDGWQDLYVSHYRIRENHLFVNQQDGTFTEEGRDRNCSGLYDTGMYYDATAGSVYGQYWWGPMYGHTIGSAWADLNNDGNLDLFTSDFVHKYVGYIGSWYDIRGYVCDDAKIYINDGAPDYTFTDFRSGSGIPIWPIGGQGVYQGDQTFSGVTMGDYDNDGWQDIYIPQVYNNLHYTTPHLYHNRGPSTVEGRPDGTQFEDVTDALGIKGADTYANLFLDYDNDGDLDLITGGADTWDGSAWTGYRMRLYENQGSEPNSWLTVKLNGRGKNLNGIGGRILIRYLQDGRERVMVREVRAGTGHAHQQGDVVHFGLGDVTLIDGMEIWWPDGVVQMLDGPDVNRHVVVDHPEGDMPEVISWSLSNDAPIEDSEITATVVCTGDITEYLWDTDGDNLWDGKTEGGSFNITYHEEGGKHIRCRVVSSSGVCRDIYPMEVRVENLPPEISGMDMRVKMDHPASLGAGILLDTPSDLANISWEISWGDGSADAGSGPILPDHVYTVPDTYQAYITCSDGTEVAEKVIAVRVENVEPWGYVEPREGNETLFSEDGSVNIEVVFFDTPSDPGGWMVSWDLGDGSRPVPFSGNRYVWHSYDNAGIYNVTAYVKDGYGGVGELQGRVMVENVKPTIEESFPGSSFVEASEDQRLELGEIVMGSDTPSDREGLLYKWDLGDGTETSWRPTPAASHTYTEKGTYSASCTVMDDDGMTDVISVTVDILNVPPEIDEVIVLHEVMEDENFTIRVTASDTVSDQDDLLYLYDLGDGRKFGPTSPMLEISYSDPGYHEIAITVVDDDDDSDTYVTSVLVNNLPPSCGIDVLSTYVYEDDVVRFRAKDVVDTENDLQNLSFSWDMGDGTLIVGQEAVHIFTKMGNFKVRLKVSDGDDHFTAEKRMTVINPVPVARSSLDNDTVSVGEMVVFVADGSTDNPSDMDSLVYEWDFGDGSSAASARVSHVFSTAGSYRVELTVTDDDGANDVNETWVTVRGSINVQEGEGRGSKTLLMVVLVMVLVLIAVGGGLLLFLLWRRKGGPFPDPPQPGAPVRENYRFSPGRPPAGTEQIMEGTKNIRGADPAPEMPKASSLTLKQKSPP